MRFQVLAFALLLSLSPSLISAHFFPNISSLPSSIRNSTWDSFYDFAGCKQGDTVNGLQKLKQYFQRFGYMATADNYTDYFDSSLESAIKTYQRNFNLNISGELDGKTIQQIVRPRCGNADIINGSSTMNSGKPPAGFHTVAHFSFFPGMPRWPANRRDLTYAFFPQNQLTQEAKNAFSRAFARWAEVIPMTFTETDSIGTADIRIGFFSGDHGDGEPFDGVLGTLAHAFSPPAGHFHLDDDEDWLIDGDLTLLPSISAVDLESVAVHEIGHLLGLGHSSVEDAIMFPSISAGTRKVQLADDDIQGVQTLYGSNPDFNGTTSSSPPVRESDSSGAHYPFASWGVGALLAVGYFFSLML